MEPGWSAKQSESGEVEEELLGTYEEDTDWQVRVASGFTLHERWNRENFVRLAGDLLNAS